MDHDRIARGFAPAAVPRDEAIDAGPVEADRPKAVGAAVPLSVSVGRRQFSPPGGVFERDRAAVGRRRIAQAVLRPNVDPAGLADFPVGGRGHDQLLRSARQYRQPRVARKRQEFAFAEGVHPHLLLEGGLVHRLHQDAGRARGAVAENQLDEISLDKTFAGKRELIEALPGEVRLRAACVLPLQRRAGGSPIGEKVRGARVAGLQHCPAPHVPLKIVLSREPQPAAGGHAGLAHGEAQLDFRVSPGDNLGDAGELGGAEAELFGLRGGFFLGRIPRRTLVGGLAAQRASEDAEREERSGIHAPHCRRL